MRDYVIITESTSDLPVDIIEELGVYIIPMEYRVDDKDYLNYPDERELSAKDFYDKLRDGGKSTTSQINTVKYEEFFGEFLEKDLDILYICFSSALSSTYNSSLIAINDLKEKYKDRNIISIDSRAASLGEGLLVYNAVGKKNEGLDIFELETWILESRDKLCHWFTVDDLKHLERGGRVSKMAATVGTALDIKPVMHVNNNGELVPIKKVRGRKKSLKELVSKMKEFSVEIEDQVIFIGHGDTIEDAIFVKELVEKRFNPRRIVINNIGPVIGSHSGPGTIALFFVGMQK
ncbi:MAG: DegV family protein [Clostridium sp.]|nr:DegV family protein [Clostridium sp.]